MKHKNTKEGYKKQLREPCRDKREREREKERVMLKPSLLHSFLSTFLFFLFSFSFLIFSHLISYSITLFCNSFHYTYMFQLVPFLLSFPTFLSVHFAINYSYYQNGSNASFFLLFFLFLFNCFLPSMSA